MNFTRIKIILLKELRGDVSLEDFARALGTTKRVLLDLEHGRKLPKLRFLFKLVGLSGKSFDYWLLEKWKEEWNNETPSEKQKKP